MAFYKKRIADRPCTPEQIAERIAYRKAAEQAIRERQERFPVLTGENFDEAAEWQERRIQQLIKGD